jgi:hypothetical protein
MKKTKKICDRIIFKTSQIAGLAFRFDQVPFQLAFHTRENSPSNSGMVQIDGTESQQGSNSTSEFVEWLLQGLEHSF